MLQIITITFSFFITINTNLSIEYKAVAGLFTSLINLFAGINNPKDKNNF
jgi:hypothetical protein